MTTPATALRSLTIACAIALTLGIAACGDNGDDSSKASSKASTGADTAGRAPQDEPVGDKAQVKQLALALQKAFVAGDGDTMCGILSPAGQGDIVDYGRAVGISGSCADVIAQTAKSNRVNKVRQEPARVVAVRIRGKRAVALIRTASVAPVRQRYTRIAGEWKADPLGLAAAAGGSAP